MEQPHSTDLSPLLRDLEQRLADAEREARALQLKMARLRGLRDGVLMVIEHVNRPPTITNGVEEPTPPA